MALPGSPGAYVGSALTRARADVFIPEMWTGEVKRFRDQRLIASMYTKRIPTLGKKGDRIHIPNISRAAVYDKLPERPVTLQARTDTEWVMDITDYKETSHMIEDVVTIQSAYPLRSEITRESGYALARDLDSTVLAHRAVINAVPTQVIYSTSPSSTNPGTLAGVGAPLTYATLLAANAILDDADVPMEDRVLMVSTGQYMQLLNVDKFISADFVQGSPVQSGVVGRILGIPVVRTSQVRANSLTGYFNGSPGTATAEPTPGVTGGRYLPKQDSYTPLPTAWGQGSGAQLNVVSALLAHKDWLALAVPQEPSAEWSRENLYQADAVVMTQQYGAKVFRNDHAVVIHTTNTLVSPA